jgi:hypothetical protein
MYIQQQQMSTYSDAYNTKLAEVFVRIISGYLQFQVRSVPCLL